MKIITLLSFALLFFTSSYAQKCKPSISEDKFTKQKQIFYGSVIDENILFSDKNTTIYMYVCTLNDTLCSYFAINKVIEKADELKIEDTKSDFNTKKGQSIYLLLADGSSIEMKALLDGTKSKKQVLSSYSITLSIVSTCTKEQLNLLSKSPITDYKIQLAEASPVQGKVNKSRADKAFSQFKCASEEFQGKAEYKLE